MTDYWTARYLLLPIIHIFNIILLRNTLLISHLKYGLKKCPVHLEVTLK